MGLSKGGRGKRGSFGSPQMNGWRRGFSLAQNNGDMAVGPAPTPGASVPIMNNSAASGWYPASGHSGLREALVSRIAPCTWHAGGVTAKFLQLSPRWGKAEYRNASARSRTAACEFVFGAARSNPGSPVFNANRRAALSLAVQIGLVYLAQKSLIN